MKKKLLFIFGTRPEAIKMAPLIRRFKQSEEIITEVCVTAQHREMLDQVLDFFDIIPDYDLNLMKPDQTLFDISASTLKGLEIVLDKSKPDLVFVQGDTTSAFIGALAAFYKKIKVAHIEAGLRSGNKLSPFPEETNRILAGHLSEFHFAPTPLAAANLNKEGINPEKTWIVGNTVIDALFLGLNIIKEKQKDYASFFSFIDFKKKIILVTGHRRESFGKPFEDIFNALKTIAQENENVQIIYPVHLNPNVRIPVNKILNGIPNISLIEPLSYPELIWLLEKSYLVLTDSGGIQEEAPSLGKPVLVMRDVTERTEGINAGTAILVGTDKDVIISKVNLLLNDQEAYSKMAKSANPYGDGSSSDKIFNEVREIFNPIVLA